MFVLEGPDAKEAARRVSGSINAHPSEVLPAVPSITRVVSQMFRDELERRGVLEDYDRMMGAGSKPAPRRDPPVLEAFAPWTPPPEPEWLKRYRELEELQKAMSAECERWSGGR